MLFRSINSFKFFKLPEWIGDLKNLNELMLHDNKLKSLPESITQLKQLQILDLRNNNLSEIPIWLFSELDSLKEIYLSGNPLSTSFKQKFKTITKLMPENILIDGYDISSYFRKSNLF